MPEPIPAADPEAVAAFVARWHPARAAERAHKDLFLAELCDVRAAEVAEVLDGRALPGHLRAAGTGAARRRSIAGRRAP